MRQFEEYEDRARRAETLNEELSRSTTEMQSANEGWRLRARKLNPVNEELNAVNNEAASATSRSLTAPTTMQKLFEGHPDSRSSFSTSGLGSAASTPAIKGYLQPRGDSAAAGR